MQEGERVAVKTRFFEGMATIQYIAPGEIYPVQVQMDEGDESGHRIQRIAWHEIVNERPEKEPGVVFSGPEDATRYIGEVIQENGSYGFKMGQRYILGVVAYPGVYKAGSVAKSFYLFEPDTLQFRGCMPANMFRVGEPYTGQPIVVKPLKTPENEEVEKIATEIVDFLQQTDKPPAKRMAKRKPASNGQLNIFDFLEG